MQDRVKYAVSEKHGCCASIHTEPHAACSNNNIGAGKSKMPKSLDPFHKRTGASSETESLPAKQCTMPSSADECSCCCAGDNRGKGTSENRRPVKKDLVRLCLAMMLFVAGMLLPPEFAAQKIVLAASYLAAGGEVVWSAVKGLFSRHLFNETLLMTIATLGAAFLGEFAEAAAVMLLFAIGELLQQLAVGNTKKSISSLLQLRPDTAHLFHGGSVEDTDPAVVPVGATILVRPYERVPLDGVVLQGESHVDESALTGESVPIRAHTGRPIPAGSVNGEGALTLQVTTPYADSAVSKIIRITEEAARQKSPREKFITRFARVYTPVVVVLSTLVATVPPLAGIGSFREWLYTALTLLVISCPCALVISVPLAFFSGLGGASRNGVLVRGATGLEALAKTEIVAFDKTGTLTKGEFRVLDILPQEGFLAEQLSEWGAYAESLSSHPIARALTAHYRGCIDSHRIGDAAEIRGRGVRALIDHRLILLGNAQWMQENNVPFTEIPPDGETVAHISVDGQYAGCILLGDALKDDAVPAVKALGGMGIRCVMLTGDNTPVAEQVAHRLGILQVQAKLLPEEKVSAILQLRESCSGTVAFVGDGINDAPVIASADIGISMGSLGSDAAIEASDVVLMTDEPKKVATAIRSAKKTLRIVRQNIILALGLKGGIILLGLLGISSMWLAILADVGTSLLAVVNSVRALHVKTF